MSLESEDISIAEVSTPHLFRVRRGPVVLPQTNSRTVPPMAKNWGCGGSVVERQAANPVVHGLNPG